MKSNVVSLVVPKIQQVLYMTVNDNSFIWSIPSIIPPPLGSYVTIWNILHGTSEDIWLDLMSWDLLSQLCNTWAGTRDAE